MCSSSDLPTVNVIEEGRIDEDVEIEGCEGDYDGFDDLYIFVMLKNISLCYIWSVILYS